MERKELKHKREQKQRQKEEAREARRGVMSTERVK